MHAERYLAMAGINNLVLHILHNNTLAHGTVTN